MYRDHKISLVIPAYNEERLIGDTLKAVPQEIDRVYVVDDASVDNMSSVVKECANVDERIVHIRHETNRGVGQAIITGYLRSAQENYDIAVVVGGDNQMPLEVVSQFLDPIIDGKVDYTKGNRFMHSGLDLDKMPKLRLFMNAIISLLTKIASGYGQIYDVVDGYTAISKRAIEHIDWSKAWKGYGYPMDFLVRLNGFGYEVQDVPRKAIYLPGERQSQIKSFNYFRKVTPMLVRSFMWRIFRKYLIRDFHPLIFFYLCGLLLFPISTSYAFWLIFKQVVGWGVTGSQSVLSALMLLMSLQFLLFAMFYDLQGSKK